MRGTDRDPEIVEEPPTACVNRHPLNPPNVQVMHLPCACAGIGGHRGYRCWTCGDMDYRPPHTRPDMGAAYRPR